MSLADDFRADAGQPTKAAPSLSLADQFRQDATSPVSAPAPAADPSLMGSPSSFMGAVTKGLKSAFPLASFAFDNPKFMTQAAKDASMGALNGAARIGTTLLNPADADARDLRAAQIGGFFKENSNPDSPAFKIGDLGAQVAGTAGAGGLVAKGLGAIPGVAKAIPSLLDAIGTGGMSAGGEAGLYGLAARTAGGIVNGGASAALVDPSNAVGGLVAGGILPGVAQGLGKIGGVINDKWQQANAASQSAMGAKQPFFDTLKNSIEAGYVVPPSSVNPSIWNTTKESISGKIATAQVASTKNQAVTDGLVRNALGLPADAAITQDSLAAYRASQHATGYGPLKGLGDIQPGPAFNAELNGIASQYTGKGTIPAIEKSDIADLVKAHQSTGFNSGDAVDAIRVLRENAGDAFRNGNSALGKANRGIADAYENALQAAIPNTQPGLLSAYQDARANIAKSFSVEKALREGAGTIDARKLADQLQAGKPLSGDLLTAASFANVFKKAAQPPDVVAGAGVHNLKASLAAASAYGGAHLLGPVGAAAGAAYPFLIPPLIRAQMFSKAGQQALLPAAASPSIQPMLAGLLGDPTAQQALLRAGPVGLLTASP